LGLRLAGADAGAAARAERGEQRDPAGEVLHARGTAKRLQRAQQRQHRVLRDVIDVGMRVPQHLAHDPQHPARHLGDQRGRRVAVAACGRARHAQQIVGRPQRRDPRIGGLRVLTGHLLREPRH
jgi:hypothetical protein